MKFVKLFASDESGATAIEYALIASLIAIALVTILTNLGTKLSARVLRSQQRAEVILTFGAKRERRRARPPALLLCFRRLLR